MKKTVLFFALIIFALANSQQAKAWGTTGHRIIAEIAERNLSKKAKREVNKLLDDQHLAYWANWPDFIKSDTTTRWSHTHIWHYVNTPGHLDRSSFNNELSSISQENVYSQIPMLENIVKDKNASKEERKEALIFLIHLVGDMHQPMHVGRADDLGGNRIRVKWFGEETNLHSLWDSKLIDFEKYSYTEYATLLNILTKKEKKDMAQGTLEDWLFDTHEIADNIYDMTKADDKLSFDYNYKTKDIVESQLQKGGIRLAKLINEIF